MRCPVKAPFTTSPGLQKLTRPIPRGQKVGGQKKPKPEPHSSNVEKEGLIPAPERAQDIPALTSYRHLAFFPL